MKASPFFARRLTVALGPLVLLTSSHAQHSDDFLVIEAEPGWSIIWDGNDGDHFDPTPAANGGAQAPDNLALASNGAVPFGSSELDPNQWDFHVVASLNNGTYGNFSSWIGASADEDKFVGIDLGGKFRVGKIAWGRDNGNGAFDDSENLGGDACGGQCDDRWQGDDPYTLQITTTPNPSTETLESEWETIGTFDYLDSADIEPGEGFTPWLRHEYEIARTTDEPTEATGIRIIVPQSGLGGGTAIDEIEIFGPAGDPRFVSEVIEQISDRPTAQMLNISVQNRGETKALNISSATLSGDPAFTLTSFPDMLGPFAEGALVVQFDPQGQVGRYLAEISIVSDDEFFPETTVPIRIQVEHANGLIAHYKMDETEGDQLLDSSGNNHHGTFVSNGGAVVFGADPLASGTAVSFSGDLAYAEVPAEAGLPVLETFSISTWVNFDPSGAGNFSSIVSKGAQLGDPFSLITNVDGPMQFFSAGLENDPTDATIATGESHHVVITHEDKNGPKVEGESEVRVYLNGELIFENLESGGFDDRNGSPLQIAATAGQFGMIGTVDDVQLYKVEIEPDDVTFLRDNPGDVLIPPGLGFRAEEGFVIEWDGNDGEHFDATAPPDGPLVPENLASLGKGASPFSSSDLGPELGVAFHVGANVNDGLYGNSNSWISASEDANPFIGVNFGKAIKVTSVAWGRDNGNGAVDDSAPGSDACGGQCDDRAAGLYTLQITTVPNPNADTADDDWTTLGTFDYRVNEDLVIGGAFTSFLRHEFQGSRESGSDLLATGLRLLVPTAGLAGGTAIDELEVYGEGPDDFIRPAAGFAATWDGNEGDFFDEGAPPDGALAPANDALAANGAVPFTSSDLGLELGVEFHVASNINDGFYGNANSWIHGSDDSTPFIGVSFGQMIDVASVAWGRDNGNNTNDCCGGQLRDRVVGLYTLQFTTVGDPDIDTSDDSWTTIVEFDYENVVGEFQNYLRHEYQVSSADGSAILATGIRLVVPPNGTAVDELEVNPEAGPEPVISTSAGFTVGWGRNDGDHFDATPPPDGSLVPDNLALASNGATAFASGSLGTDRGLDFHIPENLNDGFFGNSNSWIGSPGDSIYAGVNLGGSFDIVSIAWGRDNGNGAFDDSNPGTDACGGQCDDRWAGTYELQVTTDANPDGASTWTTVATIDYPAASADAVPGQLFTGYLRHEYALGTADGDRVRATGVRLLVSDPGIAIDEIEVYGIADPDLVWDGTDGEFFDPMPPMDGSIVPDNLALASNGATAFASGSLGADRGLDFHIPENLNDGFFGNSNSWIGSPGDIIYAGIDLGGMRQINAIAWGRDNGNGAIDDSDPGTDACGGQCDDRWQGVYVVQVTTDTTISAESTWRTIGKVELSANDDTEIGGGLTGFLRHLYTFDEGTVNATGVRIVVSNPAIAIDEIEVYGAMPLEITPTIGLSSDGINLAWVGDVGAQYTVEFSETMEPDSWQMLPGADAIEVAADGVASVFDSVADRQRYYRIWWR
ncbi:MAG: hypothetical protein P1U82_03690 [Verrucomicrobiales bacterium]|nr:hypothetical protein [Verrucomicrobiales bacterium]